MNILAKTAGVVLAAAAMCGLGVGTTAAGTPGQVGDTGSPGPERLLTYQGWVQAFGAVSVPPFTCPSDHPWLQNADLSPGQRVPHGVEVVQTGKFMDVNISGEKTDVDGHVIGWNDGNSATNWESTSQSVQVWAHCTSDPTQAY